MLAGHYVTALIAHQKYNKGTLLYFLIASQCQDLLWFIFHFLGLEPTKPNDVLDGSLLNMSVDMLYSHDLIPQLAWSLLIFMIGRLIFKSTTIGLVGAVLQLGHSVLDMLSGYPHHIFGEHSHQVGLGLYTSNVYLALIIEAVFCAILLIYFFRNEEKLGNYRTSKNKISIIGLFVFGVLFMMSIATESVRERFGIPAFDLGFQTNVPSLLMTYVGMILYLYYAVKDKSTHVSK